MHRIDSKKPQFFILDDGLIQLSNEVEEGCVEYKRSLASLTNERMEQLTSQMKWRLFEGAGKAIYQLGVDDNGFPYGLNDHDMHMSIENLKKIGKTLNAEINIVQTRKGKNGNVAEILVREVREEKFGDIRIAVCGCFDAGKSTLIGVLTEGRLDNGKGGARMGCFKHQHEITSGRTSSISHHFIGFNTKGECINSDEYSDDITNDSFKTISFIDLAGHEKYYRTTVLGLLGHMPDYCFLVISANAGVKENTIEHLQLSISLKIPIIIIITKIDVCRGDNLNHTIDNIQKLLTHYHQTYKLIDSEESLIESFKSQFEYIPIFPVSNVTGKNIPLLTKFLNLLPLRNNWISSATDPTEVQIAQIISVSGLEQVIVGGIVTAGKVKEGDQLKIGPDTEGQYKTVNIQSIHSKRALVKEVKTGQFATFAVNIPKTQVRKGQVLLAPSLHNNAVWSFEANITILQNTYPISIKHQPVIQCKTIRQCARIVNIIEGKQSLTKGDNALIKFNFIHRPEYLKEGMKILVREGKTRAIGTISKINI